MRPAEAIPATRSCQAITQRLAARPWPDTIIQPAPSARWPYLAQPTLAQRSTQLPTKQLRSMPTRSAGPTAPALTAWFISCGLMSRRRWRPISTAYTCDWPVYRVGRRRSVGLPRRTNWFYNHHQQMGQEARQRAYTCWWEIMDPLMHSLQETMEEFFWLMLMWSLT